MSGGGIISAILCDDHGSELLSLPLSRGGGLPDCSILDLNPRVTNHLESIITALTRLHVPDHLLRVAPTPTDHGTIRLPQMRCASSHTEVDVLSWYPGTNILSQLCIQVMEKGLDFPISVMLENILCQGLMKSVTATAPKRQPVSRIIPATLEANACLTTLERTIYCYLHITLNDKRSVYTLDSGKQQGMARASDRLADRHVRAGLEAVLHPLWDGLQ